ncbi:uncharacterized protein [Halyomorpha halys]|uniref:uncharacterized protein n=1 Tax=Halyomorpha halys TaxID=286706 RepID=UPI0006D4CA12|nr:uncharacterized protein LOC106677198 [Halyomorpha halys]
MSKLVKAVVGTVIRLQCPECADVFDLSWDIAEDVLDAVTGEVVPFVCARCQKSKKYKQKESVEDDKLTSRRGINVCKLTAGANKYSHSAEDNNRYVKESETTMDDEISNMTEASYTSEDLKKDISIIKTNIIEIKEEIEQLRFLISNKPDG